MRSVYWDSTDNRGGPRWYTDEVYLGSDADEQNSQPSGLNNARVTGALWQQGTVGREALNLDLSNSICQNIKTAHGELGHQFLVGYKFSGL